MKVLFIALKAHLVFMMMFNSPEAIIGITPYGKYFLSLFQKNRDMTIKYIKEGIRNASE